MKIPFGSISVPQERFNAWSLVVSCVALLVAIASVFANGVPNWMKSQRVLVYPDKGFQLQQNLGRFQTILTTTVINNGGSDIGLKDMTLDLVFENGNKLLLVGDSWYRQENSYYTYGAVSSYSSGEYRLSDVVVRPGQSWTGIIRLIEKVANERGEAIEDFNDAMFKEQRKSNQSLEESLRNAYRGFVTIIASGKADKRIDPSVDWSLLASGLPAQCAAPTATLVQRGRDLTAHALQRMVKGKHVAHLKLTSDGRPVFDANYDFVLFERELSAFRSEEALESKICTSTTGGSIQTPTSTIRIALTSQNQK